VLLLLLCTAFLFGCSHDKRSPANNSATARALFEQTTREFHGPSAEAHGAERERLLNEAAKNYGELLKRFPQETNLCAQAVRALGSIRASQGKTNEAVKLYATVEAKCPDCDWEVLMAWKSAADLLWDLNQRADAKKYYAKIVERFGKSDAPQIIQQVVRGSKARLAE
jgi:lipopolysaccharide biosynthesis regulator YciM